MIGNGAKKNRGRGFMSLFSALFLVLVFVSSAGPVAMAHPGAVDGNGGHREGSSGRYHFNKGPLAGQSFVSKETALKALRAAKSADADNTTKTPELHLATFNIRIFSDKSRSDEELDKIVSLLKGFDLVAIQELRDTRVLERTKTKLNEETKAQWRYEASEPVGRGVKERYAFLYRSDRVLLKEAGRLVDDVGNRFIRKPYYATFKAGFFDFTLLTIHALYKSKDAPERKGEFDALAKIFSSLHDNNGGETDIILLGDFNDPPTHGRFAAVMAIPGMRCLFQPPLKTTISDDSLYDNICFEKQHVSVFLEKQGVVNFDEAMFNNNDDAAKLAVSDHRPVWAVFATDRDGN